MFTFKCNLRKEVRSSGLIRVLCCSWQYLVDDDVVRNVAMNHILPCLFIMRNNVQHGFHDKQTQDDETTFQEGGSQFQKKWYRLKEKMVIFQ